jgi:hypothetical protein
VSAAGLGGPVMSDLTNLFLGRYGLTETVARKAPLIGTRGLMEKYFGANIYDPLTTSAREIDKEVGYLLGIKDRPKPRKYSPTYERSYTTGYATGGIVTGPEVPFTKEDPADRVDPFTGEPYQEQMSRLGFNEGGRTEEYFKKLSTLEDYISKNRLVSKEAQMSAMSGEGYSDPRFIKTTGNELIDKYGMQPFPAEGSGKILSSKELGMKEKDFLINAHQKGTYDPQTDVIQYKDISAILPSHTPERTQIHEIVHRAAERSGWLDNFYNDKNFKKIAPKLTGARGKQLKHIINEGLAHSYDYTLANKRIDSEELKEQIKFRVSNYNIKDDYKDRVTKEIFESLPALQENFEQYLKDKEESK